MNRIQKDMIKDVWQIYDTRKLQDGNFVLEIHADSNADDIEVSSVQ